MKVVGLGCASNMSRDVTWIHLMAVAFADAAQRARFAFITCM